MYTFASTYITGLNNCIERWLQEDISDVEIIENLDGLVIYKTKNIVQTLPYVNNSFLLLDFKPCIWGGETHTLKI